MKLCSNRPEGFGPHSSLSTPLPTTCFTDTILLPLPTWTALLLTLLLTLSLHHRKQNSNPSTAHLRVAKYNTSRNCAFRFTSTLYYILIACNILMQTLEIVRLELLHFGIGLQPFVYIGLVLGLVLHTTSGLNSRIRGWVAINYTVWIGGVVMNIIQAVGLAREGMDARKGSKYPVSDQVTDVVVIAGVYAVVAGLEVGLGVWRRRCDVETESDREATNALRRGTADTLESVLK